MGLATACVRRPFPHRDIGSRGRLVGCGAAVTLDHRRSPPASLSPAASASIRQNPGARRGLWPIPAPNAPATIRAHEYTLAECLALAERNFPSLWAAYGLALAFSHGQLEEAEVASVVSVGGVHAGPGVHYRPSLGTVVYPQSTTYSKNITFGDISQWKPAVNFNITGTVPLYTFGKIEAGIGAAEAGVRVSEWDMEKWRQQLRMDVRRAYYGLQFARDGKYVVQDALDRIDKGIRGIKEKIAKGDPSVSDIDRMRLEFYRLDVTSQSLQAPQGEAYAIASLRFMTGVQVHFDIVDQPLQRPDRPLVSVARKYLEKPHEILRPEVNMARAGIVAKRRLVDLARARLYPDLGLLLSADFASSPSAIPQQNAYAADPFNHFGYIVAAGLHWNLDILPGAAPSCSKAESSLEETRSLERLAQSAG